MQLVQAFSYCTLARNYQKNSSVVSSTPSSIKKKWSIYFNNCSTGKLICCTTYLWMFCCTDTFSYVWLFLIISVFALQQKKGMEQYNFWKYAKICMLHLSLLAPNLEQISIAFTTDAICLSFSTLFILMTFPPPPCRFSNRDMGRRTENNPFYRGQNLPEIILEHHVTAAYVKLSSLFSCDAYVT